jgi:hypothetical protein
MKLCPAHQRRGVRDNNGGHVLAAAAATVGQPTTGVVGTVTPMIHKPRLGRPNPYAREQMQAAT